jgi:hypothetical protein
MYFTKALPAFIAMTGITLGVPIFDGPTGLAATGGPGSDMIPHNTTMPDGSAQIVWIHEGLKPVEGPSPDPGLDRRLKWNPKGTPNQCGDTTYEDMTTLGSPDQLDCQVSAPTRGFLSASDR